MACFRSPNLTGRSGLTLLEVVVALVILGIGFYYGVGAMLNNYTEQSKVTTVSALDSIEGEVTRAALASAQALMASLAAASCKPATFSWQSCPSVTGSQCNLASGVTMELLDINTTPPFVSQYPQVPSDLTYSDGLSRCENSNTFYSTLRGTPISDFSQEGGLYFCAHVFATPNGTTAPPPIASMQPVLVEFMFMNYDVKTGTQLTCQSIQNSGVPSTNVGMLYYTFHWSTNVSSPNAYSRTYSSFLSSGN